MSNKKATKRALLTSILAICLCLVMLIGSTFAWFTDTASTGVNTIQSGTLKLALDMEVGEENGIIQWDNAEGKTLEFKKAAGAAADEKVLWEPGCTYELPALRIRNDGNLALKYKIAITGVTGNAKLLEAINFTVKVDGTQLVPNTTTTTGEGEGEDGGDISLTADPAPAVPAESAPAVADLNNFEGVLLVGEATGAITISGTMRTDAGNEYQGLSIDGIAITVTATQKDHEYDSDGNDYDKDAEYDKNAIPGAVANYTLAEFNALTAIPEGVGTVYVDLGGASLQNGLTIGNANIVDDYEYFTADQTDHGIYTKDMNYSKTLSDGKTKSLYSTEKAGFNLILTGSVAGAKDTGNFNAGMISLSVPDACNVTFNRVTFGEGQMSLRSWYEALPYDAAFHTHKVASLTFNGCTFNGNWLQNGDGNMGQAASSDKMSFVGCTFNKYENAAGINSDGFNTKNNSNPIWIQNMGHCDVTIESCSINAVRPFKLWEGTASGAVTIKNNMFNMDKCSIDTDETHKNIGVMFCGGNLDNVEITGNTVTGDATAFICFYSETLIPTMNSGATFTLSGNTLPTGTLASVVWKTATAWTPNYVNQ